MTCNVFTTPSHKMIRTVPATESCGPCKIRYLVWLKRRASPKRDGMLCVASTNLTQPRLLWTQSGPGMLMQRHLMGYTNQQRISASSLGDLGNNENCAKWLWDDSRGFWNIYSTKSPSRNYMKCKTLKDTHGPDETEKSQLSSKHWEIHNLAYLKSSNIYNLVVCVVHSGKLCHPCSFN